MPPAAKFDTFHRNPKRKRGNALRPRSRFGLRSMLAAGGIAYRKPRSVGNTKGEVAVL